MSKPRPILRAAAIAGVLTSAPAGAQPAPPSPGPFVREMDSYLGLKLLSQVRDLSIDQSYDGSTLSVTVMNDKADGSSQMDVCTLQPAAGPKPDAYKSAWINEAVIQPISRRDMHAVRDAVTGFVSNPGPAQQKSLTDSVRTLLDDTNRCQLDPAPANVSRLDYRSNTLPVRVRSVGFKIGPSI